MRNCIDEGTLQAWFDGELAANPAADVTRHLGHCASCADAARILAAENSVLSEGLTAEFAEGVPTERLRERVDAAVAGLRFANASVPKRSWSDALRDLFPSVRVLAYASATATILLAAALLVVYLKRNPHREVAVTGHPDQIAQTVPSPSPNVVSPLDAVKPEQKLTDHRPKSNRRNDARPEAPATSLAWEERQYERAIAKLNEAIKAQPPMRPSLQVEYEFNLALVDNAIATTRDVARKNPRDPQAAQFMLAAYQSKVDLMNQIADARVLER